MPKPIVVIVGRPNVGKSTLFNRMTRSQAAITESTPGVTRDRNYRDAEWEGKRFIIVDTGGFYPEPSDEIFEQVKEQALFAIDEADVIVHLLNGKEGLVPSDRDIARLLRASGKRVIWAVNKIDAREDLLYDFSPLGAEDVLPVSAATGYGFDDFMEKIAALLPSYDGEERVYPQVAVVGRPNVGKSTLINTLLGRRRMIVSPHPGTTRDSIDSVCTYYGKKYLLIDTAGIRRRDRSGYSLDRFAAVRSVKSIERCDIALIVLDASEGVMAQDQKIAGIVDNYGKGAIFLLNKWDLVEKTEDTYKALLGEVGRQMWFMHYAPVVTVSALERKRVTKVFPLIDQIMAERRRRIPTSELNRVLQTVQSGAPAWTDKGRPIRMKYLTQISTNPPSFAIFVRRASAIRDSHKRHIERVLRSHFPFAGTPVRIYVRSTDRENR